MAEPPVRYSIRYGRTRGRNPPLSANRLAKAARIPSRTVYDFVEGKAAINSDSLGRILDALDLRIVGKEEVLTHADLHALLSEAERITAKEGK